MGVNMNELFEKENVAKAYFRLALPVVFSNVISLIYNMVDTYFIAMTKDTNLIAGVALGSPIFILMIALGDIFGLGGSSVISRLFGGKQNDDARRINVFCFYGAILCGLVVCAVLLIGRNPILTLLGADEMTKSYASAYYTWIAIGAPAIILTLSPSNILRTEGLATQVMIASIAGSVVNMILDPIFIMGFGWGAGGAALATVIGNVCTDCIFVWILMNKSRSLSISLKGFFIKGAEIVEVIKIGVPASITNLMQTLAIILLNRFLHIFGNDKVAAMGIVAKINMLVIMIMVGFAFGGQPLIGYNYGAKNTVRLKQILKFCFLFEIILAIVLCIMMGIAAPFMMGLFVEDTAIIVIGTHMLRAMLIGVPFMVMMLACVVTFQAAGKAMNSLILSLSRQGIIFVVVINLAFQLAGYQGIVYSQTISDILTSVIAAILLLRFMSELKQMN